MCSSISSATEDLHRRDAGVQARGEPGEATRSTPCPIPAGGGTRGHWQQPVQQGARGAEKVPAQERASGESPGENGPPSVVEVKAE